MADDRGEKRGKENRRKGGKHENKSLSSLTQHP